MALPVSNIHKLFMIAQMRTELHKRLAFTSSYALIIKLHEKINMLYDMEEDLKDDITSN